MTHPDANSLLRFVLQTLDEPEMEVVEKHLSLCEQCRREQRKLDGEVKRLSSIDLSVEMVSPPELPQRTWGLLPVLRVAAVLAAGFLLGYATAQLSNPVRPIPVQQRLIPSQLAVPSSGYVPAQEVDVRVPRPM